jgi:TP901-1 family phage major tail protein
MATVQGKDDILKISADTGTTYKTVVCETTHSFQFTRNSSRTATKCDSGTSALALGSYEWSFQASFVVKTDPAGTETSYEDILGYAVAGTALLIKNDNPLGTGTNWQELGTVYITDLSKTAEVEGLVSCDVTFSGDGALDVSP